MIEEKIACIGDIHRSWTILDRWLQQVPLNYPVIQVGDNGLKPTDRVEFRRPVYTLFGNHDYWPMVEGLTEPTEIYKNFIYVPHGCVLTLAGRRVGFFGGADSVIDRHYRRPGIDWWPEERPTQEQVDRACAMGPIDLLITHTPPASVVRVLGGYEPSPAEDMVEQVWQANGQPLTVSGHMHPEKTQRSG